MVIPATSPDAHYTWDDYRTWPDDERWELIGGQVHAMSPSPSSRHQKIVGRLFRQLAAPMEGRPCEPYLSPLDVKLSEEDVVQPDLLVVCDPDQDMGSYIEGAPSLVVEILSSSTLQHDRGRKSKLYAQHGVSEYWIVTPFPGLVEIFLLHEGRYFLWNAFKPEETLASPSFPELKIDLSSVFDFPLTDDEIRETSPAYGPRPRT